MGNKLHKELWQNFSYLALVQLLSFVLSLVVIPYTVFIVGVDGFGIIAVAQVVVIYLAVAVEYGFNQTAARDTAINKNDVAVLSSIFSTVIISRLFLCVPAFGLLATMVWTIPLFHNQADVYFFAFSFVIGQALSTNWLFQGLEKMKVSACLTLTSKFLFASGVYMFIKEKDDLRLYLLLMGSANILSAITGIVIAYNMKIRFVRPGWSQLRQEWRGGWQIMGSNLSMTTIQYAGLFILRLFTNDLAAGIYSIVEKIYLAMKLMLESFSQAFYPRVCIAARAGAIEFKQLVRKIFVPFLFIVLGVLVLIIVFADSILYFFLHYTDPYAANLLRALCLGVLLVCLNIPAAQLLLATDRKRTYFRLYAAGMLVNLGGNLLLAPTWGAAGTVLAILLTELVILAALYLAVRNSSARVWT